MTSGRRASDWLTDTNRPDLGGERRDADRRGVDRRGPRRRIDTLFAAMLINQVSPAAETLAANPYAGAKAAHAGALANTRA